MNLVSNWKKKNLTFCFLDFLEAPFVVNEIETAKSWFKFDEEKNKTDGIEESLKFISTYIEKEGPFDGLLGFSQGAMMIPIIISNLNLKFKFCILVGPNYFKGENVKGEFMKNKIEIPSLIFSGEKVKFYILFNFQFNSKKGWCSSFRTIWKIKNWIFWKCEIYKTYFRSFNALW